LGIKFNVPILSGIPEILEKYKLKSNIRSFFESCNLPVAPGIAKIKSEEDLYKKLTILILNYPQVKSWIFKIDNEFSGRGTAVF
jgi:IQ domain-containing protein H